MIIVTGATGFIGVYLVDELTTKGVKVIATGRSKLGEAYYKKRGIPFIRLDISNEADFDQLPRGAEAVVHLASLIPANVPESRYSPQDYVRVNVIGTLNVLEFCRRNGVRKLVYTHSHSDVEGWWDSGEPITENAPRRINYVGDHAMYIISKNAAVDCIKHYIQEYGIQGIIFRLPPVYGYGPHVEIYKNGKLVKTGFQTFLENASTGKPLELWGDVNKGRDIIYVKDVVSAIISALKSKNAVGLYNIASGRRLSLKEEAETIRDIFSPPNHPSEIIFRSDMPNSIRPFLYDISKAKRDLGWEPAYSFKEMLLDYKREEKKGRFSFLLKKEERRGLK